MVMKTFIKFLSYAIIIFVLLISSAGCKKDKTEKTITIPLVTWGGYAALFAANNGAQPTENSLFYKYGKFKVKLVQVEDPALHLTGFAKGDYPIIWSTVDMIPLLYSSLSNDARTVPKIIGLFDYSAGGDGIIARGNIKSGKDLKGKKIVLAQYTPSHFFMLWYLNKNGISPQDVKMIYVEDAIVAKDTYIADKTIDICVTWSPFIYDITDPSKKSYVTGSKLLLTSAKNEMAYGIIADVYLARADFVKENPEILTAFTKAMIEGYDMYMKDSKAVAANIANLFGIKGGADEVMVMFNDVTIGSKDENKKLFDDSYEFSVYNLINTSTELYRKEGKLTKEFTLDPKQAVAKEFMMKAVK
jgi:NitT/TauT family transport system substrate-binding protein